MFEFGNDVIDQEPVWAMIQLKHATQECRIYFKTQIPTASITYNIGNVNLMCTSMKLKIKEKFVLCFL